MRFATVCDRLKPVTGSGALVDIADLAAINSWGRSMPPTSTIDATEEVHSDAATTRVRGRGERAR
jgi:hypothetical protein